MNEDFKITKLFNNANKIIEKYHLALQPICKKTGLPPMALDILLFIANNPENATAKEMCKIRGFKTGIVSVHIERMVAEGLLERFSVSGDRRQVLLKYTALAKPIVLEGQSVQIEFGAKLLNGIEKSDLLVLKNTLAQIERNIDSLR